MAKLKLPYIKEYTDKTGRVRRYVRRRGFQAIALPGLPGSAEFMAAYQDAVAGLSPDRPSRHGAGSVGALFTEYYRAPSFSNLKPNTKKLYRGVLGKFAEKHGHRLVRDLTPAKASDLIEAIGAATPGMANLTRSVLHKVFAFAIKKRWRSDNPFSGVETYKGGTRHTWTDDQMAQYEVRWPLGTRERLAYALLLYTGQRGGDVVRMARRDAKTGKIKITQEKTGKEMVIAIHPALDRAIKAGPANGVFLIGDVNGRPIKRAALTGLMKRAACDAGLPPECLPHGLRKALQRRLAELGVGAKGLQAVAGHSTLKETERYTRDADQARMFKLAIDALPDDE